MIRPSRTSGAGSDSRSTGTSSTPRSVIAPVRRLSTAFSICKGTVTGTPARRRRSMSSLRCPVPNTAGTMGRPVSRKRCAALAKSARPRPRAKCLFVGKLSTLPSRAHRTRLRLSMRFVKISCGRDGYARSICGQSQPHPRRALESSNLCLSTSKAAIPKTRAPCCSRRDRHIHDPTANHERPFETGSVGARCLYTWIREPVRWRLNALRRAAIPAAVIFVCMPAPQAF